MTPATGAAIFGCAGSALTAPEAAFFRRANPFGFILFARNVESPAQLCRLTADLRASVGWQAPVFIDQEGGRVQRLRSPHWREWLPPLDMVAHATAAAAGARSGHGAGQGLAQAARAVWLRYRIIAAELQAVGIDGNCAPCLDIAGPATHPFLHNRCLGEDGATVTTLGRAAADGLLAGGVLPVIKHIPGHGRGAADSHHTLPVVTDARPILDANDFAPFAALRELPVAMTAHVVYADIDASTPATTSAPMIRLIREDIGFDGLLLSDDLSMNALSGTVAERAAATIAAGVDIALHCNGDLDEMAQLAQAAGLLSPDGQRRAIRALAFRTPPVLVDIAAAEAELSGLLNGQGYV